MFILYQAVYSASFPEDIPTNKGILTVAASDTDSGSSAEIQYSLFGIGVEDFYMDANTGNFIFPYTLQIKRLPQLYRSLCLSSKVSCVQPLSWTEK